MRHGRCFWQPHVAFIERIATLESGDWGIRGLVYDRRIIFIEHHFIARIAQLSHAPSLLRKEKVDRPKSVSKWKDMSCRSINMNVPVVHGRPIC